MMVARGATATTTAITTATATATATTTADSSAALRNDNKRTGNGKCNGSCNCNCNCNAMQRLDGAGAGGDWSGLLEALHCCVGYAGEKEDREDYGDLPWGVVAFFH